MPSRARHSSSRAISSQAIWLAPFTLSSPALVSYASGTCPRESSGLPLLPLMPDPLMVSSGSIRIVAKRRGGAPVELRAIRSIEPTHAR